MLRFSIYIFAGAVVFLGVIFLGTGGSVDDGMVIECCEGAGLAARRGGDVLAVPQVRGTGPDFDSAAVPAGGSSGEEHVSSSHIVRQWRGVLSPGVEDWVAAYTDTGEDQFRLPAFDGVELAVRIQRVDSSAAVGGSILRGSVEGEEGSLVSLSSVGGSTAGSVILPTRGVVYEVRPAGDGEVYFSEVNTAEMGECHHCVEVPLPPRVSLRKDN